jgi:aminoglycoside phosphotransferase (APT) family kinase protein
MSSASGRFTEPAMHAAICHIADQLGISSDNARLLRLTNNAVYALPDAEIVIRITRSNRLQDRVHKVVDLARWFEEIDAPTIRLAPSIDQPLQTGHLRATVWRYIPPAMPEPMLADLGSVLREFHSLGLPPFPLPRWDPVADVRRRMADAEALRHEDREFIQDWCDRLEPRITDLNARTEPRLVHADAHVGNVLRTRDGRVVLCDFDATCVGPWQVDLVAVPVGEARFGREGAHRALASSYGYDVTTDHDWPLLREARELKMVAAAIPLLTSGPGVAEEFAVRLGSIKRRETSASWTPFASLRNNVKS